MKTLLKWEKWLLQTSKQCALLLFSITLLSACARLEYVPQKKFYGDNTSKKSGYLGTLYLQHGDNKDDELKFEVTRQDKKYQAKTNLFAGPIPTDFSVQAGGGDVRAGLQWSWKFDTLFGN